LSLYGELKRRNVLRAGAAYAVAAWLLIQVAETIFPLFGYGDAPARIVVVVLAVGFLPAMVFAWIFELTPEGFKRDREVDASSPDHRRMEKRLDRIIMAVLALALAYFGFDKFVLTPQREAARQLQLTEQMETIAQEARLEGRTEALVESYGDKSIAVLPFTDMSPEGDQEYLSDGIAEELLNLLATVPELRVISRTSAFAFKGQSLEVPEIARRLKVDHVLEGSVRKAGNQVRITAQLIEARSDTHLWSQTWDRELANVFAIQDEIAQGVVASLKSELLGKTGSAGLELQTVTDPKAYEFFLKGRHLLAQRQQGARGFFEQAIAIDPDYAPAWAGLAKGLALSAKSESDLASARSAALRALDLEPGESDALAALGLMARSEDVEAARKYWERAIASNPNNSDAYRWMGLSFRNLDSVRYLDFIHKAYLVDPTNRAASYHFGQALVRFGRVEEALTVARDYHQLYPGEPGPHALAGDIHTSVGRTAAALRSYYQAFRVAPDRAGMEIANLAWLLSEKNQQQLALAWALRLEQNAPGPYLRFQRIVMTLLTGDRDQALDLLTGLSQLQGDSRVVQARSFALIAGDYGRARELWEQGNGDPEAEAWRTWDAYWLVDYALTLQRTGAPEMAKEVIDVTLARMQQQMAAGVRREYAWDLRFYTAILCALRGETRQVMKLLRENAAEAGLDCVLCLSDWPHFDSLRGDGEFEAFVAEQEAAIEKEVSELREADLLLDPEQVLSRDDPSFDPFNPTAN
jgi:TolB-like protein/tetratricopeptide (TPR) repeat protein